ncbi:hypothetical protein PAESOLCIP111_01819 [Paenibacillus solanacearum]|uniref:DUF2975 domain-containing protein n=1 Tax=Paenibacillus solanacearum TaxID=2048548 RepID=A0A916JYJ5_9BACL|nr:DUF2975 domain-containing protein [Paenibacillus solanacearum]CAG7615736.1 hypothetical protein PAESOLCIP111_01819 [Paenibacillus solanacearum]
MKQVSTGFLKGVVVSIGIAALALSVLWLPGVAGRDAEAHPETAYLQYPFLLCAYLLSIPFFTALYQTFQLLCYIDGNKVFSVRSVKALRYIRYCAILISIGIAAGITFVMMMIDDDIAGVVGLSLMCTFASSVIATFAAMLQKLVRDAIELQSENELTV